MSKEEQNLSLQIDALKKHGVVRTFTDKQTGTRFDRKEFLAALAYLNEGDTLVVWKLDRLGRSLKELIETVENLHKRSIALVSLTEHIDTTTATGRPFIFGCWSCCLITFARYCCFSHIRIPLAK